MVADDKVDGADLENTAAENGAAEPDLSETMVSEGLGADDLEAEMATQMAAESLGSDEDDLEAQMAAAMSADDDDDIGGDDSDDDLEAQMAAAMGGGLNDNDDLLSAFADEVDSESTSVRPVSFGQLSPSEETADKGNIERLMDVGLNLSVELGRKEMQVREILSLGPGKIIELDKLTGEPVDLLVNGKLLAKGEVVVVDENFGVRITELIDPVDRIKLL
ncbi:flagellar motor switch protein FliN [Candidatus Latescibacterota bacterium]